MTIAVSRSGCGGRRRRAAGQLGASCTQRAKSQRRSRTAVQPEQAGHPPGQSGRVGLQPLRAVEQVLQRVVRGVADVRLRVDEQPRPRSRGQHVARVQVGGQQHRRSALAGSARNSAMPVPRQAGVHAGPGRPRAAPRTPRPTSRTCRAATGTVPGRRLRPTAGAAARRSPRPAPAPAGRPAACPGRHRSSSSAIVSSESSAAYSRTAPCPAHTRSPSASCSAS